VKHCCFFLANFDAFFPEVEPNPPEEAHIHVGNPDQSETGDEIAAPVGVKKLIASDQQKRRGYVVAETVFTGKEVEELALINPLAYFAFGNAIIAKFANNFFMSDGPRNRGNGEGEKK
jgi:hypothetical protein